MKKLKSIFLTGALIGLLLPLISLATSITECPPNATGYYNVVDEKGEIIRKACFWGLVPCGGFKFDNYGNLIIHSVLYDEDGNPIIDAGWKYISKGKKAKIENPCQICHLFVMLDGTIDFVLFNIVFPLGTLLLVIGGGMFMLSSGEPQKITSAKKILFSTIVGLIIIFSSWLMVNTLMTGIGVSDWAGGAEWFQINCPIVQ
jgi:hypothetical protein